MLALALNADGVLFWSSSNNNTVTFEQSLFDTVSLSSSFDSIARVQVFAVVEVALTHAQFEQARPMSPGRQIHPQQRP